MAHIFDVIDRDTFKKAIEDKYVKHQTHPDFPYTIYNYTDACTWDQAWDEATLNCRGLIVDDDANIIARGMPKFFNSDQEQAPTIGLDEKVIVSEKMDGSLGILYKLPDGSEAIATRGSFVSEQAIWATKWWNENRAPIENYWRMGRPIDGLTFVFEVIYPNNRIVVDYEGKEGLVLLGAVVNSSGAFYPIAELDGVECAPRYEFETWADVLASPQRVNSEGFVVQSAQTGDMVKVKYEDYKRLHKYMTRVTERHVWECLMEERDLEAEFAGAPDEFHEWIRGVAARLWAQFEKRHLEVILGYRAIRFGRDTALFEVEDPREAKKNFALAIKDEADKALYFLMLDDRTITPMIWKELKPEARTFKVVSTDAD